MAERTIPRPQAMSMIRAALRLYSDDVASLKAFDRGFRRVTVEYDPNNPDRFIVRDLLGENAA
jgi:hypothetical protein